MSYMISVCHQGLEGVGVTHYDLNKVKKYLANNINDLSILNFEYSLMGSCWFMEIVGELKNDSEIITTLELPPSRFSRFWEKND